MFTLLKGISTKVLVGVIVVLLATGWFFFKAYSTSLVEKGSLETSNVTLQQNVDHVEQSAKITDKVVNDFVDDSKKSQQTTVKLRKEALNEYINKIEPKVVPKAVEQSPAQPDGADRVGVLAKRMHENYCRARPEDARCPPVNTNQ
jgi:hypothetical protein